MKQIIAMGGGGFTMEENPLLDLYVIASSSKKNPKITFLGTASADNPGLLNYFMETFSKYPCEPKVLEIFNPRKRNLGERIVASDIIYVGGGNTKSMLGLWKEWGIDLALKQAYENGTILAGVSAGMVCWFKEFLSDSIPKKLSSIQGLGLLDFSACPHYDSEEKRRPTYQRFIKQGMMIPGYAADNCAALHFVDGKLFRSISSRADAKCFNVSFDASTNEAVETPLETIYLKHSYKELIIDQLS